MMHHVLFAVPRPMDVQVWARFAQAIEDKIRPYENYIHKLAESVWLVDNKAEPRALAWLIATAENHKFGYAIAAFDNAPEWLRVGFDPRTSQP